VYFILLYKIVLFFSEARLSHLITFLASLNLGGNTQGNLSTVLMSCNSPLACIVYFGVNILNAQKPSLLPKSIKFAAKYFITFV